MSAPHSPEAIDSITVKGVLHSDKYGLYPYETKDLEIGFSKYGEMATQHRGLAYNGLELFIPLNSTHPPLEGWFLQYKYFDHSKGEVEGRAYALYSNPHSGIPREGRSRNLVVEPLDIIYDGPRRFIAQATIHIMKDYINIINLKQTLIFNKVHKHVVILMDVSFLKTSEEASSLQICFSRRVALPVSQDQIRFQSGIETAYNSHRAGPGTLDLATISINGITAFAAYWPATTQLGLYGLREWNKPATSPPSQGEFVLLVGGWQDLIRPGSSKRFVTVYGAVDGFPEGNKDLKYQLDRVFNPWGLRDALTAEYRWILVGRNAEKDFTTAKILKSKMVNIRVGFDGVNPNLPEIPALLMLSLEDYYDSIGRLHFKTTSVGIPVAGSNMIVIGSLYANMGSEYFNDFTDVLLVQYVREDPLPIYSTHKILLYAPSSLKNQFTTLKEGIALISIGQDPNGTRGLCVWGWTAKDTYYAVMALDRIDTRKIPDGATSIIIKLDYTKAPFSEGFLKIVEYNGTIMSWERC